MRHFLAFILIIPVTTLAQNHSFPFGKITSKQLDMKIYEKDTSAAAVVLQEFVESHVDFEGTGSLIFEHHYIVKILKKSGVEEANITIPVYKTKDKSDRLYNVTASSFNYENGSIKESKFSAKDIFTETKNRSWDFKKFTIPNVKEGSVIEILYSIERPYYIYNFQPWQFQSHIPKVVSEYWATIPGHLTYNITWKGYLKFKKNEGELVDDCYLFAGNDKSDCARYKFVIENVPAFIEEDYMTAESNFIAAVNFELLELTHMDGRVDKVTKEWKDVDDEMRKDNGFGGQIKKGKEISQKIEPLLIGISDPTEKAKKIYDFIKISFTWDDFYGMFSNDGIKKAFERKKGSIGDINLSLIAALRYAGFDVEALVLSTRANGLPTELHPVITDFNYVVAKLNIADKVYLLDASDPSLPFGLLPERCLNGKGRVFGEKPSYWYDLKTTEKNKWSSILDLSLQSNGHIIGTVEHTYYGYQAYERRKKILSFSTQDEYIESLSKKLISTTIKKYEITGVDGLQSVVKEKFDVDMEMFEDMNGDNLLLNPFFGGKIERNPFRSNERLFPVDYGAPPENTVTLNLSYPSDIELIDKPEKNSFSLPVASGKFDFDITEGENKLTMNYSLSINKSVFTSVEYRFLKELYSRVIQVQQGDLLFRKKK